MPETSSDQTVGTATNAAAISASEQSPRRHSVRISWEIKAVLPVAVVLLNGLILFVLATVSLQQTERHAVLLVASSGAVAICAVMIVVLALLIHRPVRELQEKIARVGAGELDTEVKFANRNDEIGDLGRNFNQMVRQLREGRDEIQRLHQTQMSRAEHLATMGELAAGLAHEIRNPLAGIAGVIEIIGRDLPASSPARAVVKEVRQEVLQINRIVSDLLECARPKPPETRLSDINATVEHAVMFSRQQALSKSIDIEFRHQSVPLEVEHDSNQVNQVLLNLLLNSIQSIDHRGKITVTVERHDGVATIAVTDTGRGIAPEHLPHIFRPFYTTKGNGTGLGLSLARRIVEEHGGRIEVRSTLGHGSTVTVFLPLRRASAHAAD
ncbi:MAG TPA: ATP-binding protein [Terriglobales bacterium]|nr:ATP-binding protein [Terriglobales bacterium]